MARAVTFGEIMMRLAPPAPLRLSQSDRLDVTYAGAEANVAVSLAAFGHAASFVTALPGHALADAAVASLAAMRVDTSAIARTAEGRLGVYYLETGAAQRASQVIYDRAASALALAPPETFDWPRLLAGCQSLHTTGITPALSERCAESTRRALSTARQQGLLTSFDLNYRAKLWSREAAQATVAPLLADVDLLVGNESDAFDVLGVRAPEGIHRQGAIDRAAFEQVAREIHRRFGVRRVALTIRESESASLNHWSACLLDAEGFHLSRRYTIQVVDRVGAGDAFTGALLAQLLDERTGAEALEFAVAASCLKHSIVGDFNRVSRDEVLRLLGGDGSGRVVR